MNRIRMIDILTMFIVTMVALTMVITIVNLTHKANILKREVEQQREEIEHMNTSMEAIYIDYYNRGDKQ